VHSGGLSSSERLQGSLGYRSLCFDSATFHGEFKLTCELVQCLCVDLNCKQVDVRGRCNGECANDSICFAEHPRGQCLTNGAGSYPTPPQLACDILLSFHVTFPPLAWLRVCA
jgi:hypothetical protein